MEGAYCNNKMMHFTVLLISLLTLAVISPSTPTPTRRFHFNIEWKKVTRLCHTKQLLTMNGKYPGPTIAVNEGDNVEIQVNNRIETNTTIHWHGIRQMRTGWADGPAYVTQCPIAAGKSYTYKFNVEDHRGTLWWHAHVFWQRASVYGALVIYPRMPYPFATPIQEEVPIIFGEWWNTNADEVEKEMLRTGGGPNVSDAYTINGLPGPLYSYSCNQIDTFIQTVIPGKTYMFRIISAALNNEIFFAVANHTLTVVEVDALYVKPFKTSAIMIAPGQTTTVLLTADHSSSGGVFAMRATPYVTAPVFPFDNSTAMGFLRYHTKRNRKLDLQLLRNLETHNLPQIEDTAFATKFSNSLRSLASSQYPCRVPQSFDKRVVSTISLQLEDCPVNGTCLGYFGKKFFASMNNQSFIRPSKSLLQSYYHNLSENVYTTDFPDKPPNHFNFTGVDPINANMNTEFGSKIMSVPYGTNLEIVFQNTNFLHIENHPIHVHGHNFFIVGRGFGNFNPGKDTKKYNLVDPPERNTVAVPSGGWAAIRFKADNPGVWFIHCHLELHTSWGLATAFIVENGPKPSQSVLPPPDDLPSC